MGPPPEPGRPMKKTMTAVTVLALAAVAGAIPDRQIMTCTSGAVATSEVTSASTTIRGYIDTIQLDVVNAGSTATVWVVSQPEASTVSAVDLLRITDCDADTLVRPRFDPSDTAGTALTNDPPYTSWQYPAVGEVITFGISNCSATNKTFKAIIKFDR
jgi:hypothetical protein